MSNADWYNLMDPEVNYKYQAISGAVIILLVIIWVILQWSIGYTEKMGIKKQIILFNQISVPLITISSFVFLIAFIIAKAKGFHQTIQVRGGGKNSYESDYFY